MPSLNKVMLIGNLTRDPELRYVPSGAPVAEFGLAINRQYTDREGEKRSETCFVDVVAWRKQAELCDRLLTKGSLVCVEGRLQLDTWETSQGERRTKHRVVAERFQLLGGRSKETRGEGFEEDAPGRPEEETATDSGTEDDIPF